MRKSVYRILKTIGLKPRLFSYRDIRIDSQKDMRNEFRQWRQQWEVRLGQAEIDVAVLKGGD